MSESRCPRCDTSFHCGVADSQPCWCVAAALDASTRKVLAARYVGCLCAACLAAAQAGNTAHPASAHDDIDRISGR